MLFNSLGFLVFFPIVAIVYYIIAKFVNNRMSNIWLLIASYYFYINLRPAYAIILFSSTLVTYFCGLLLGRHIDEERKKKTTLTISLLLNFGILFVFKYYNFINSSIESMLSAAGIRWNVPYLNILLPVGISFYIFQSAGYVIDVYRGTVTAERDLLTYSLFVSFFPVILAGPIQRSKILIPQLKENHPLIYDNVVAGLKMMLWGYFMKLCVADRMGTYVDSVFNNLPQHNGTTISIAAIFYTIQIYGDFAGYSLVALGCARTMGFILPDNFRRPYFSTTVKEFWKRWHIGLSSWFGDYLYIPLGGNRVKYGRYLLNLMIVFLVSGLWHGAAWTFVIWGAIHGLYQIVESLRRKSFGYKEAVNPFVKLIRIVWIFTIVCFAWIFFRANSISDAFSAISRIITEPGHPWMSPMAMFFGCLSFAILFIKDFVDEFYPKVRLLNSNNQIVSSVTTSILLIYIILFGVLDNSQFIYFQF